MTSMVLFPGPLAVPALGPDPELDERHPDAKPATAMPMRAVSPAFRFNIPAPPWRVGGSVGPKLDQLGECPAVEHEPT
jgi:hypothetical protein